MALTDSDRRRFLMATALTLVALPALWWSNQNDGAPNVATTGIAVADADVSNDVAAPDAETADGAPAAVSGTLIPPAEASAPAPTAASEPANAVAAGGGSDSETTAGGDDAENAPVFLDGPSGQVGAGLAEIAVPAPPAGDRITTKATFRSSVGSPDGCAMPGVLNGATITVVNLDNNRSVTCTTLVALNGSPAELVMHPDLFARIADLTDAPIPVEIRR